MQTPSRQPAAFGIAAAEAAAPATMTAAFPESFTSGRNRDAVTILRPEIVARCVFAETISLPSPRPPPPQPAPSLQPPQTATDLGGREGGKAGGSVAAAGRAECQRSMSFVGQQYSVEPGREYAAAPATTSAPFRRYFWHPLRRCGDENNRFDFLPPGVVALRPPRARGLDWSRFTLILSRLPLLRGFFFSFLSLCPPLPLLFLSLFLSFRAA